MNLKPTILSAEMHVVTASNKHLLTSLVMDASGSMAVVLKIKAVRS